MADGETQVLGEMSACWDERERVPELVDRLGHELAAQEEAGRGELSSVWATVERPGSVYSV